MKNMILVKLKNAPLREVSADDIARFLQGEGDSHHNHPCIIGHGGGFTVATKAGIREFKPSDLQEAFRYYEKMLIEIDYHQVDNETPGA